MIVNQIINRGLPGRKKKIDDIKVKNEIKTDYKDKDNVTYFKLNVQGMIEGAQVYLILISLL